MLEPAIEALPYFFAKVADVIGRYDGHDIGRQAAASRFQINPIMRELHIDSAVEQLAQMRPVPKVPRAPVDFVNDDALGLAPFHAGEHFGKYRAACFRGGLFFFEPLSDLDTVPISVRAYGGFLFFKRNALALFRR
ncbi:MAG TPA: hypothetical protein VGI20_04815 [Rhizomicrobium sp.]